MFVMIILLANVAFIFVAGTIAGVGIGFLVAAKLLLDRRSA